MGGDGGQGGGGGGLRDRARISWTGVCVISRATDNKIEL